MAEQGTIMLTGVQYQATDQGSIFQLVKDDVTGDFYWLCSGKPGEKFKQVFVPLDFNDPAIAE